MKILVSACLLGTPCRYDGQSKASAAVAALGAEHELIPVCPEVLGGLPTPRPPAERQPDGRILNRAGQDVTAEYETGAAAAVKLARQEGCPLAILKARSPSCGRGEIYDGGFSGTLVPGDGAAARRLLDAGVTVLNENEAEGYFQSLPSPDKGKHA